MIINVGIEGEEVQPPAIGNKKNKFGSWKCLGAGKEEGRLEGGVNMN